MDAARQLARRLAFTIADERVLRALEAVPRERFVPESERARAYDNVALPIACDQTISQPLVVARMLELLELTPRDTVLDVGTGSGYHAALLSRLAGHVWTVELRPALSAQAAATLSELGCANVSCVVGDGWAGWPGQAPYDAINLAAAPGAHLPSALADQLAPGGRLVAPLGRGRQYLTRIRRTGHGLRAERMEPVRFVPLVRSAEEDR